MSRVLRADSETTRPFHTETMRSSLADDVVPVTDQVVKQIENLRLDGNPFRSAMQFAAVRIKRKVFKQITQAAIPSWRTRRKRKNSTAS